MVTPGTGVVAMGREKCAGWMDTCKPESSCSANSGGQQAVTDRS